jgi:hypothetical protein
MRHICLAFLLACRLGLSSISQADFDHDCAAQSTSLLQVGLKFNGEKTPQVFQKPDETSKVYSSLSKQRPPRFNCSSDFLLVFSRGKTGSSSLDKSFSALCSSSWKQPMDWWGYENATYPSAIKVDANADVAQDFLSKVPGKSTVWIFTMVRNPFARAPSMYYQSPNHGDFLSNQGNLDIDVHIEDFRKWLWQPDVSSGYGPFYKEEESSFEAFANVTGVHVDPNEFNRDEHHLFTSTMLGDIVLNIVLLRLEDSDHWEHALSKYMPGFSLKNDNIGDSGIVETMYKKFEERFIYSDAEKSEMLKSDALPFYSKAEIDQMLIGQMVGFPR